MRALVIDDDGIYRDFIRGILERLDWAVDVAEDGQVGWRMFQSGGYDLVVCDIFMPHQEGLETMRLIRQHDPAAHIVAVSGGGCLNLGMYLEMAHWFGANRWLAKPFRARDLEDALGWTGAAAAAWDTVSVSGRAPSISRA